MDVFSLHQKIIDDYSKFVQSFIEINDDRINEYVQGSLESGQLWPDPLIQLNPSFEKGGTIESLVENGILHEECNKIFRIGKNETDFGSPLQLHKHQSEAIISAKDMENYVLTTGTGSGKSLSYIIPIVDYILQNGSGNGIKAIVVYPMNALANSQFGELEKFLSFGYPNGEGPVTYKRYTGQESDKEKREIISDPPDILITNYVMLELILTRVKDRGLINAAKNLKFLVFDELHTYRGRQGADVSMLIRRLRDKCGGDNLQCIGTSATMAGEGNFNEQREEVSKIASTLFGTLVKPENVIGETLRRSTPIRDISDPTFIKELTSRVQNVNMEFPNNAEEFIHDPLAIWIESIFGLTTESETGRLIRTKPKSISGNDGAVKILSNITGESEDICISQIQKCLMSGYQCKNPNTGFPIFAFRLHAFISKGDTIYASLESEDERYISLEGQQYVPNDRNRVLLPLCFCRECGQEYYTVNAVKHQKTGETSFVKRGLNDSSSDRDYGIDSGFLYINSDNPWPSEPSEIIDRLPDDWLENKKGEFKIKTNRKKDLPKTINVSTEGKIEGAGIEFQYISSPFRFCLNCGVAYSSNLRSDFTKLSTLGSEGRSTATTILSLSSVKHLKKEDLLDKAKKLLSFTDNRQDASLQAGHFNDFVEIGFLRSSLYKAVNDAGANGIQHDVLTQKVFQSMNMPISEFASNPEVKFAQKRNTELALRNVLGYRLYQDLQRGWRITSPNLEQCGLLEIDYLSLDEVCEEKEVWQGTHEALLSAAPITRFKVAKALLDHMRRELAIKVDYLNQDFQERMVQQSSAYLIDPWAIDEDEKTLEYAKVLYPRSRSKSDYRGNVYLSEKSGFGQYLRRFSTFPDYNEKISLLETKDIIDQLLQALVIGGILEKVESSHEVNGYQINASAMLWFAGDGIKAFHDPIRIPNGPENGSKPNPFFVEFYKTLADEAHGLKAREHTAQVPSEERLKRETDFRAAKLPILYCSPTMELGVDISQLNLVNMRNIPPTPANYAQRSGRAGRSGQPALVFTYCSAGSNHDQYFFKNPELMVAGAVTPPRIDLSNEELIKSHIYAIWLEETQLSLGTSLKDLIDLDGENPTLELLPSVMESINDRNAKSRSFDRAQRILSSLYDVSLDEEKLTNILNRVPLEFDEACNRWRDLYKAALKQRRIQDAIIVDASRTQRDKNQAKRLRREAESQLELLLETNNIAQSDFYSYRYFASEGFLPGYNFPRLPLSAYIHGKRKGNNQGEYLSRPRFLALNEFGPRSIIYHEGSRYIVNKVIMPVREEGEAIPTRNAKICPSCGYLHPIQDAVGPDLCEQCNSLLEQPLQQLFRMENVATKRRSKINSDEEERLRLGYEVKTVVKFADNDAFSKITARVNHGNKTIANISYGHAATLWKINLGWSRRKDKDINGFVVDLETGFWAKNDQAEDNSDEIEALTSKTARVIPYVEDRRNCMLFEPQIKLSSEQFASLQSAIKNAIQIKFQLEDTELSAQPLPDDENRRQILFYESAEGGAGVLRRLIEDNNAFSEVIKVALEICHFDPRSGKDMLKAPKAVEECEAACYYCLMNYSNQRDHSLLDRKSILNVLLELKESKLNITNNGVVREDHLGYLINQSDSSLEEKWLKYIEKRNLRLPSKAQPYIESCQTRPDFLYEDQFVVVYIDGPYHDFPERQTRDINQTECLEDLGYTVIRFGHQDDWAEIVERYSYIFGGNSS
ncbi:DEAD/DEAH box helicase [Gracilibacillus massiliensis]|uniref:DEAD/DEAH box helicase n=1 Tax=Gracilibacillus massiliensis TaxID=1564956 RepID=UPI00071C5502|nr:DEAD/DEAH box helicase [Gracilibacillus massiliensis]